MLPVLDGLLPEPHNSSILDLVFVMGCWHAYAKLRLHTEQTLASFESLTADLGTLLRHFSTATCAAFKTTELPKERAARIRRTANTPGTSTSGGGSKAKGFNLNTYKFHALGDYAQTIRERGTTDNYTSQRVGIQCYLLIPSGISHLSPLSRLSLNIGTPRACTQGSTSMIQIATLESYFVGRRYSGIWIRAIQTLLRQLQPTAMQRPTIRYPRIVAII